VPLKGIVQMEDYSADKLRESNRGTSREIREGKTVLRLIAETDSEDDSAV